MNLNMHFLGKLIVFSSIPVTLVLNFLFFLPVDFFNFRVWEALLPHKLTFDGIFYPNHYIQKIEHGDLGLRTSYSVDYPVIWQTDGYGFRYSGGELEAIDLVIIGDSFTVGSSLTQSQTLAAQLTTDTSIVYPYAPATINQYLSDGRFVDNLPEYVLVQRVERNLGRPFCIGAIPEPRPISEPANIWDHISIQLDIAYRTREYANRYISSQFNELRPPIVNPDTRMLFLSGSIRPPDLDIALLTEQMLRCQQWFQDRGSTLIFMPVPDKETIYFEDIPMASRADLNIEQRQQVLRNLIASTSTAGIPTIDLLSAFTTAADTDRIIYQLDDTHWNADGVSLAAPLINAIIISDTP
ncbi:MAG: hypothetical protein WBC91_22835 [Phototrophicaceae bacterium]